MSKMMLKMLADMAGVSPDEIMQNVEHFRETAMQGVQLLREQNMRLARIEQHLGIEPLAEVIDGAAMEIERQE